jgi:hypothetical protein
MHRELHRAIKSKRKQLVTAAVRAHRGHEQSDKAQAQLRIRYLDRLLEQLERDELLASTPQLFVSFSREHGEGYAEKVRALAPSFGFEHVTGFDDRRAPNVLSAVRTSIDRSSVFLAIMTPETAMSTRPTGAGSVREVFAPSVWVVEEKGMALALNKPFRMLVHEAVAEEFWQRTTPDNLHHRFNEQTFDERAREALGSLERLHEERDLMRLFGM